MRRITRAFAAASIVLLGTAASQAAELNPALPPVIGPGIIVEPAPPEDQPLVTIDPTATAMFGRSTLRVDGQKVSEATSFKIAFDLDAQTFSLLAFERVLLTGHLAPKGKSGRKFTLFLDEGSHESLTVMVAKLSFAITNRAAESILGDTTTLVMKLDENGLPSLKVKSHVLTQGFGAAVFKASFAHDAAPR
jgi:hypothetical protein